MLIFYWSLRFIARIMLQIYFKKVIIQGEEKIAPEKPLLIAVNHPNSFLEACVLACWLKIPLHFIVRGDVFHPSFRWFFNWTNQIPIYRFRDGFSRMRDNVDTFIHCYKKLDDGENIVIFCEGSTKWTKQLRPIQRGTGRIAKGAIKNNPSLELQIVPIGVNFEDVFTFRSSIEIKIGEPIDVPPLMEEENTINIITQKIHERLSECVVHIEEERDIELFDIIAEVKGIFQIKDQSKLYQQFQLANKLNENQVEEEIIESAKRLTIVKKELSIHSITPAHRNKPLYLPLYLWWPVHFLLSLALLLPAKLAKITARNVYDHTAFEIPIRLGFSLIYYIIYIAVIMFLSFLFLPTQLTFLLMLVFIVFGFIYPYSYDAITRWKDQVKWYNSTEIRSRNTYIEHIKQLKV